MTPAGTGSADCLDFNSGVDFECSLVGAGESVSEPTSGNLVVGVGVTWVTELGGLTSVAGVT